MCPVLSENIKQRTTTLFYFLMQLVALLFLMKLIFQSVGTIPYFATTISSNIDLIIGYLHWTFLGVVSIAILAFLSQFKLIHLTKRTVILYLIGFFLTEGLLFYKGITVWLKTSLATDYLWYLAVASSILLLGIAYIFMNQFRKTTGN